MLQISRGITWYKLLYLEYKCRTQEIFIYLYMIFFNADCSYFK